MALSGPSPWAFCPFVYIAKKQKVCTFELQKATIAVCMKTKVQDHCALEYPQQC